MKNLPHSRLSVRLSVVEGAKILGVTQQAMNNLVNDKAGICPVRHRCIGTSIIRRIMGVGSVFISEGTARFVEHAEIRDVVAAIINRLVQD